MKLILNRHHFSFQGKNAPATVSGKTPTERLHNAWLKLQADVNCCIDSDLDKLSTVKFPGIRQVCVCVCFQVDCGTGTFVTSFNLANLYLEEMWATHIYTQKSCLHVNICHVKSWNFKILHVKSWNFNILHVKSWNFNILHVKSWNFNILHAEGFIDLCGRARAWCCIQETTG